MLVRKIVKAVFILFYSQLVFGQQNIDLIRTQNYLYSVQTPKGWQSDHSIKDVEAGYYPKKSSWYTANTLIYVKIVESGNVARNFFNIIDTDIKHYVANSTNLEIEYGEKMKFDNGNFISLIIYLHGAENGKGADHSMAVAYIPQHNEVMNIVMSANTRKDFEKALPAFKTFVASYDLIHGKLAANK